MEIQIVLPSANFYTYMERVTTPCKCLPGRTNSLEEEYSFEDSTCPLWGSFDLYLVQSAVEP